MAKNTNHPLFPLFFGEEASGTSALACGTSSGPYGLAYGNSSMVDTGFSGMFSGDLKNEFTFSTNLDLIRYQSSPSDISDISEGKNIVRPSFMNNKLSELF